MPSDNLSFKDMMDMPLDSSPLKEPSPRPPIVPGSTPSLRGQSLSPSPSPSPLTARHKRPAEDLTQFADEVSRAHKLAKQDHDDLARFSKLGNGKQMVYLAGQLLALRHQQNLVQPAAEDWKVPKRLQDKIDSKAAKLMADSSIPAYRDSKVGPAKLLFDQVMSSPSMGFPTAMKEEKQVVDTVASAIGSVLISKRNIFKAVILTSLGSDPDDGETLRPGALNIVDLVALVLTKLKSKSKPDLRMCGRVAILRKLVSEKNDKKYWANVDDICREMFECLNNSEDL